MAGAQAAWGIDVGNTSLKAIKLLRDGDRVQVEAFDVIEHDANLSDPNINRDEAIKRSIQKFLDRHSTRRDAVFISVPGSMAFARFVKLPPVEPKSIPEIVRFEAIQQIPFLDQVNWDYHTFQTKDSPDVEVGIFAMKKDLVEQVLTNFHSLGITVQGVQMSPLAVYNAAAYDQMDGGKGRVLVDMGAEHTDLVVIEQGRIWMRSINIGGSHFTEALSKSFKRPFEKAEDLKKNAATSKYQKQIFQAMRPVFADLVADIQRSIGHYNSSHRDSQVNQVIGMGNPFKLPNLQKYLQQELKMPVKRLDTFKRVNADPKIAAALNDNVLSLTAAYGLAVQGLGLAPIDSNLLPVEIARKMMWRSKQPWFIGATALIAIGVAAVGMKAYSAGQSFKATQNGTVHQDSQDILGKLTALQKEYSRIPNTYTSDQQTAESFVKLAQYRGLWPSLTLDILDSLPQSNGNHRGAATEPAGQAPIVVLSIDSQYSGDLTAGTIGGIGHPGRGARAPSGGGGQAAVTGSWSAPIDTSLGGGPAPPPPPPKPAVKKPIPRAAPTPAKSAGESNRGFIITIHGYTVASPRPEYFVQDHFANILMAKAPDEKSNSKPYYFSDPSFPTGGMMLPSTLGGGTSAATPHSGGVWGVGTRGAYFDMFVPEMIGTTNLPTTGNAALPPIDAFPPADPKTGPHLLTSAFEFTFTFHVHVK